MPSDTLLDIRELRETCHISRSTAFKLAHHLGAVYVGGALRVRASALDAFLAAGGAHSLIPADGNGTRDGKKPKPRRKRGEHR